MNHFTVLSEFWNYDWCNLFSEKDSFFDQLYCAFEYSYIKRLYQLMPLPPKSQYNTVCLGHITNDKLACKLQYCCLLLEEWIIAQQHERWLSLKLISLCLFMALFHIIYIRMWNQAIKTICHKVCSLYFSFLFDYELCQQYPFLVDE